MNLIYRAITLWPGRLRAPDERVAAQFRADWTNTMRILDDELAWLGADECTLELAVKPRDVRMDGTLRRDAAPPDHPGVIVSFDSNYGPLRYWTDVFDAPNYRHVPGWRMNVRAVALGLRALRAVDRYGISERGEQYVGWAQLPPARPMGPASLTPHEAAVVLAEMASVAGTRYTPADFADPTEPNYRIIVRDAYRVAAKLAHPDAGGNEEQVKMLNAAKDALLAQLEDDDG